MNEVIPYLVNAGVAGAVLVLFILNLIVPKSVVTEKNEEIRELKHALTMERQRADAAVAAASVTKDVLLAFRGGTHEMAKTEDAH